MIMLVSLKRPSCLPNLSLQTTDFVCYTAYLYNGIKPFLYRKVLPDTSIDSFHMYTHISNVSSLTDFDLWW